MPSNYEAITKDNEEQLGKDTASRKSQVNMYSDFSHFVYEILQNADDYGATEVSFELKENELIIEHNGIPFEENNVKCISYFGASTSRDDLVKTGRFGLGFKSVFAFTASPIIHSGDEDFELYALYRIRAIQKPIDLEKNTTRIVLPFNHVELQPNYVEILVDKDTAFKTIYDKLQKLDLTTLLFTRNIIEIQWEVNDSKGNNMKGHYLREDKDKENINGNIYTRKTEITDGHILNTYIVYSRPIKWNNEEYKPVDVAFLLNIQDDSLTIQPLKKPLFVLFPTTVETNIGFLINGPFRTPAHRETVSKKDDFNKYLIKEICSLLILTFHDINNKGLISISFLYCLPIRMDDFSEDNMFYPIVTSIRNTLSDQNLLPTDDGSFVSARNAKLASAEWLRKLLRDEQLRLLFRTKTPLKWINGEVSDRAKHDLWKYIKEELKVEEVTPDSFARRIDRPFLENQTVNWFIDFYSYLFGQEDLWRRPRRNGDLGGLLRTKPILLLQDDSLMIPFRPDGITPNAFFPPPEETDYPIVKREIVSNEQAADFLKKKLGLQPPDIFDEIVERVLPKYTQRDASSISQQEHSNDIKKILFAMSSNSETEKMKIIQMANRTPFLNVVDHNGRTAFKKPTDIYFPTEELTEYFSGSSDVWFISEPESEETWLVLGVENKPRFKEIKIDLTEVEKSRLRNEHKYTWESTINYELDGLGDFLSKFSEDIEPSEEASLILWNFLLIHLQECPYYRFYEGEYKWFYYREYSAFFSATWKKELQNHSWLPCRDKHQFCMPGEIRAIDLPESFIREDRLAELIGMKNDVVAKLAEEAGIPTEDIDLLRKYPEEFNQWKVQMASRNERPEFPTRAVPNPEHRQKQLIKQFSAAPEKEYKELERSVRTTRGTVDPKIWLRNQYTNDTNLMICQICKKEMPFKGRDREYYFEAVEALSKDHFPIEYEVQFLALCPLCAAMYKEFVKNDESNMVAFKDALSNSDTHEIALQLGEKKTSIRFIETHWLDIRTILKHLSGT